MQTNTTTEAKKRGRPELSPNGLVEELSGEKQRKGKKKQGNGSRYVTEVGKRLRDKMKRQRYKRLRQRGIKEELGETVRKRMKAVRYYRHWRERFQEGEAALRAAQKHAVSVSTIRSWDRRERAGGLAALFPKKPGPVNAPFVVPLETQFLVVALRRLLGWNEKRMAAELSQRGLAQLSHTTVGLIFKRYTLPTRTYHPKARCDGILKRRYEKKRPNQQWHIDFAESRLQDNTPVLIIALVDDYSRYCLRCQVVPDMTAETALQTVQSAWQEFGLPEELVSDNGRAFTSVHQGIPTAFGKLLQHKGIHHHLITPYWPEGNGKAEAFIKIVKHECLNQPFINVQNLQQALAEFVLFYNHFRLHSSLGYKTPVSRILAVETVNHHGLCGIPGLPASLKIDFPPSEPVFIHPVNQRSISQRFALALLPLCD